VSSKMGMREFEKKKKHKQSISGQKSGSLQKSGFGILRAVSAKETNEEPTVDCKRNMASHGRDPRYFEMTPACRGAMPAGLSCDTRRRRLGARRSRGTAIKISLLTKQNCWPAISGVQSAFREYLSDELLLVAI